MVTEKKTIDKELSRNGSGYYDPTAYKAMKRVEADEKSMVGIMRDSIIY